MRRLIALMTLLLVSSPLYANEWVEVSEKALSETLRLDGVIEAVCVGHGLRTDHGHGQQAAL